jgi:hypothetical protein
MVEFLVTFGFFLVMVFAMAIGVLRGRAPISGTCGGLNQMGAGGTCEICGGRPEACRELDPLGQEQSLPKKPKITDASKSAF